VLLARAACPEGQVALVQSACPEGYCPTPVDIGKYGPLYLYTESYIFFNLATLTSLFNLGNLDFLVQPWQP
jgi:hypothetical protein